MQITRLDFNLGFPYYSISIATLHRNFWLELLFVARHILPRKPGTILWFSVKVVVRAWGKKTISDIYRLEDHKGNEVTISELIDKYLSNPELCLKIGWYELEPADNFGEGVRKKTPLRTVAEIAEIDQFYREKEDTMHLKV